MFVRSRRRPLTWFDVFPNLGRAKVSITSCDDNGYNCIAWAVGDASVKWDPSGEPGKHWPPNVTRDGPLQPYIALFCSRGYAVCDDGTLEPDFEKVALYVMDDTFKHVAWQNPDGTWVSKLGGLWDIEHERLEAIEGDGDESYGRAKILMKRPRQVRFLVPALGPDFRR